MEITIKETMTNTQIVNAIEKTGNIELALAAKDALFGIYGEKPDRHDAFVLIEKALREKKNLRVVYVEGESASGEADDDHVEIFVD